MPYACRSFGLVLLFVSLTTTGVDAAPFATPRTELLRVGSNLAMSSRASGGTEALRAPAAEPSRATSTSPLTMLDYTLPGSGAQLGNSVATAGDVNGDGYSDLIVGALFYSNGQSNEGEALLFLGGPSGYASTPAWTYESNHADELFGASVAPAGDVNGDGYADVIVGAPHGSVTLTQQGTAYVFLGGPGGLASTPAWTISGEQAFNYFGVSVSTAGDMNGDGYDDVVVGASGYSPSGNFNRGRVYGYLGGPGGLSTTPGWTLDGGTTGESLGNSVAAAGDFNGDGYDDVVAGGPGAGGGGPVDKGRVEIVFGGPAGSSSGLGRSGTITGGRLGWSVSTAGDVDGDGYADILVGEPQSNGGRGAIYVFRGNASGTLSAPAFTDIGLASAGPDASQFGSCVGPAGDVNGDGYADFAAGAPSYDASPAPNGTTGATPAVATKAGSFLSTGYVQVYEGRPGPSIAVGATTLYGTGSSQMGYSVCAAGDANGDGFGDLAVGSNLYPGGNDGRVQVFRGAADAVSIDTEWRLAIKRTLASGSTFVGPLGDVNGDGYDDFGTCTRDPGNTGVPKIVDVFFGGPGIPGTVPSQSFSIDVLRGIPDTLAYFESLGDVNGDGYNDVVVQGRSGCILMYGSSAGLTSASVVVLPQQGLHPVGDVNGDGYADVELQAGIAPFASIHFGAPTGISVAPSPSQPDSLAYLLVAPLGDVNGDGFEDALLYNPGYTGTLRSQGRVALHYGGPAGLTATAARVWVGADSLDNLMPCQGPIGDLNGDGYADYCIGTSDRSGGVEHRKLIVYYGNDALAPTIVLPPHPGSANGFISPFSFSVGDVDGDGFCDLLVTHAMANTEYDLYRGSSAGIGTSPSVVIPVVLSGEGGGFGGMRCAQDLNGDGFSDVMLDETTASTDSLRVLVHYGNSSITGAPGLDRAARQRRVSSANPIALGGVSDSISAFRLAARGRSAAGRTRVRMQADVQAWNDPFATNLASLHSGTWQPTGAPGSGGSVAALNELEPLYAHVNNTVGDVSRDKWRTRIASRSPYFPWTPWLSPAGNGRAEADVRARRQGVLAVGPPVPAKALALSAPWPNPSNDRTQLSFTLPARGSVDLSIFDLAGRRVAQLAHGAAEAGRHDATWNGRDASGRDAAPGVYLARLVNAGHSATQRIVRLR